MVMYYKKGDMRCVNKQNIIQGIEVKEKRDENKQTD